jgi:BirA family biotin operon repressor/biotin-[acetyl-CoA-carboxylase] ligase
MTVDDYAKLEEMLDTRTFGRALVLRRCTGSTNTVAQDLAVEGAVEGTVVVADEQTAGRGRMGRRWVAPAGTCLLVSILFRPTFSVGQAQQLTMLCSMAAADAVEALGGLPVLLKWPNDLVVDRTRWRKLAGVLTETGMMGDRLEYVVVGIGINVNVPAPALDRLAPDATSILAEVGREVHRGRLLAALLAGVEDRYRHVQAGKSPHPEWADRLATLGRRVQVTTARHRFSGVAEGVTPKGALLVRDDTHELHTLAAGDVTLSPPRPQGN